MSPDSFPSPVQPDSLSSRSVDVLVIGGGMAGVMAALAAKTPDNRVLLVEPSNVLGGQGTTGGVAGFCGDSVRVNDEFARLVAKLTTYGLIEPYRPNEDRRAYDLEWCAFFLQEMVIERGIEVLLLSRVIGAVATQGRVTEVTVSTSGGMVTILPRFTIDASGACVVPLLTGFPCVHEGANRQLPMSLYFTLWDTGRPITPVLPDGCPQWANDAEIPMTSLHRFPSGKVEVKMKVVGFDAADGVSRSAAEIFARRQMHGLIYYLQTVGYRGKKLDTHVLASVSRGIGIREERRIVGEHVLTEEEARRAVIFPDAVAVNTYHIDFHWPDRMQRAGTGITDMLDPHHLPLSMMIPKGAKNLLVPGRGSSGDQTAMSAYRVMAVVAQMGFAAGQAARLCLEDNVSVLDVDLVRLQTAIKQGGQSLDLSDYGDYLRSDLFTHEQVVASVKVSSVQLRALTNARFKAVWKEDSGVTRGSERREKVWSAPALVTEDETSNVAAVERREQFSLLGGEVVRIWVQDGALIAAVSRDGGRTFFAERALAQDADDLVVPAAVATRVGLACLYATREQHLRFWHGSIDRIVHGPPVPSSARLDAPPDHVEQPDALRA